MEDSEVETRKGSRQLWLVKLHYLLFFAALGPILPQVNVFGKQLGISPSVMGYITFVLPFFWAAAKPMFGYIVDHFSNHRKIIFIMLILSMSASYCGLGFINKPDFTPDQIYPAIVFIRKITPLVNDTDQKICIKDDVFYTLTTKEEYSALITRSCTFWNEIFEKLYFQDDLAVCIANATLIACETDVGGVTNVNFDMTNSNLTHVTNLTFTNDAILKNASCYDNGANNFSQLFCNMSHMRAEERIERLSQYETEEADLETVLYRSPIFWIFVVLSCLGTVAFNVANCISDAICFDVLDSVKKSSYGVQRAFGTIGYGTTALLAGWLVDKYSTEEWKDFTPALLLVAIFTGFDLICCSTLKLPKLSQSADPGALRAILACKKVLIFIFFAIIAGFFDSFIIYYMFWYLEEMVAFSDNFSSIKLIEGLIVAGQSFVGELLFFYLSGRIIGKLGYAVTFTLCLLCYATRMFFISLIKDPWYLIPIEAVMQGPTYALCYSTIVGYAATVAPPGYSATVQGIVAGMDDGVGFALGSIVGGYLYKRLGGAEAFRCMSIIAVIAATTHGVIHFTLLKPEPRTKKGVSREKDATNLEEAAKMLELTDHDVPIYRETTVPIKSCKR